MGEKSTTNNIGIITVRSGLEAGVPPQVASLQSDPHLQALVNHVLPMVTGPSGAALLQVARGRGRGGRGRGKSKSEYNFSAPQIDSGGVLGTVLHGLVWCYMALHGMALHGMAWLPWHSMALHGLAWRCMALNDFVWGGIASYCMVWRGMTLHGVV